MPCGGTRSTNGSCGFGRCACTAAITSCGRVRAGHGEHLRMRLAHEGAAVLRAEAAGDDHLAVLGERLADRVERFRDRGVDEAAGVDDDEVGAVVGRRDRVALGAQLREDLLGVDERLRAAERDEADARRRERSRAAVRGEALACVVVYRAWQRARSRMTPSSRPRCTAASAPQQARCCGAPRAQRFLSVVGAPCGGAAKLGNGNAVNIPRVWSCIRCCMSMKSFALCSR